MVAFFHFLLSHRMADIQDWVFFHGWEILALGKVISLIIVSRFIGILSSERRPFYNLYSYKRGFLKKDLFIALVIFLLGMIIIGLPKSSPTFELDFYRVAVSYVGQFIFYGSEVLILLALNEYLPLKRKQWHLEVVLFSLLTFLIHKSVFLYGERWEGHVIFFFILIFYSLKMRGEFGWIHPVLTIFLLVGPISSFFGLDPLWGSRFSPFYFGKPITGLEIGVFTLVSLLYFRRRQLGLKS